VKADDLLDALHGKALEEVKTRHDIPEDVARDVARSIAVGALRYFLLRFTRNTVIAFDFKEALSFDGETGPYVQYAVVRANNICKKFVEAGGDFGAVASLGCQAMGSFLAAHDDVWELTYQAARLPEVVKQVSLSLELSQLAKYTFQLAQRFNLFYHRYHILSEADRAKQHCLLAVVDIVRKQLTRALDLLGCEVPPRM
jgi:arginyl-tRNA synthetase